MPEGLAAGGSISPKRIVRLTSTGDNKVVQATAATASLLGISGQGTRLSVATSADAANMGYHAISGEPVRVFKVGETAPLVTGTGGVTAGDKVTSDGSGKGITATTGQYYVGDAMETVAAGVEVNVLVNPGQLN